MELHSKSESDLIRLRPGHCIRWLNRSHGGAYDSAHDISIGGAYDSAREKYAKLHRSRSLSNLLSLLWEESSGRLSSLDHTRSSKRSRTRVVRFTDEKDGVEDEVAFLNNTEGQMQAPEFPVGGADSSKYSKHYDITSDFESCLF